MLIEVESLKELEPGKTYAVQLREGLTAEERTAISRSANVVGECYGMRFIVFTADMKLIDAPKEITSAVD